MVVHHSMRLATVSRGSETWIRQKKCKVNAVGIIYLLEGGGMIKMKNVTRSGRDSC